MIRPSRIRKLLLAVRPAPVPQLVPPGPGRPVSRNSAFTYGPRLVGRDELGAARQRLVRSLRLCEVVDHDHCGNPVAGAVDRLAGQLEERGRGVDVAVAQRGRPRLDHAHRYRACGIWSAPAGAPPGRHRHGPPCAATRMQRAKLTTCFKTPTSTRPRPTRRLLPGPPAHSGAIWPSTHDRTCGATPVEPSGEN